MTTDVSNLSASDINLADNGIFRRNEAHDLFRILRREAPVHWTGPSDINDQGFWSLTKLQDVLHVSRNPQLFISSRGITMGQPPQGEDAGVGGGSGGGPMAEAAYGGVLALGWLAHGDAAAGDEEFRVAGDVEDVLEFGEGPEALVVDV